MPRPRVDVLVRAAYRRSLRLYPRDFRRRFEDELCDAFDAALDESRGRGRWRAAARLFRDLVRHAAAERWSAWQGVPSGLAVTPSDARTHVAGGIVMNGTLQDARFALRAMWRRPTSALAVIITMALGVGATSSIWAAVDHITMRPLPFPASERAVRLCETGAKLQDVCVASVPNVQDWRAGVPGLEAAGVGREESFTAVVDGERVGVRGGLATAGLFDVLGIRAARGRLFTDEDLHPQRNGVAILSDQFWRERFAGNGDVVGRAIVLDGRPTEIVGVLPANAYFPMFADVEVWRPVTAGVDDPNVRGWRGFAAFGRRAPDTSLPQLQTQLEAVQKRLAGIYASDNAAFGVSVQNLRDSVVGGNRRSLWFFLAAAGLVLAIACANVAGLLLVRASSRGPEFALRAALGAGRGRLARQLLTESLVMAGAGGALGLVLAAYGTRALVALAPAGIPRLAEVHVDARVALFTIALTSLTALAFGLAPARAAARAPVATRLGSARHTGRAHRTRAMLVAGEIALALVLLANAAVLAASFVKLSSWQPGFDRTGVTVAFAVPQNDGGRTTASAVSVLEQVRDAIASVPGVQSVGLGSAGPLFGGSESGALRVIGDETNAANGRAVNWHDVDPHYFHTLGRAIRQGRDFLATDTSGAPRVAIVNETLASRTFPAGDAIGRQVTVDDVTAEIVGVVADAAPFNPADLPPSEIYWPIRQYPRMAAYVVMRIAPGVAGIEAGARARARAIDPSIQVGRFSPLERFVAASLVSPRFNMVLIMGFAGIATLLAGVGVYGLMAAAAADRTREMGIRLALGARPAQLVGQMVAAAGRLTIAGIVIGCAGAWAVGRAVSGVFAAAEPPGAATLAGVAVLLGAVSLTAGFLPSRRAARVDPVTTLRAD